MAAVILPPEHVIIFFTYHYIELFYIEQFY